MNDDLGKILLFTLIPVVAVVVGGIISSYRKPGQGLRIMIQHFAAGVVFSAVALQLLPELVSELKIAPLIFGFSLGVALMIGLKRLIDRIGPIKRNRGDGSSGLLTATAIDMFIDGLLVGVSFSVGVRQGVMITIALTIELLLLGLSVASSLISVGVSKKKVIITTVLLALCVIVGAGLGGSLLEGLSGAPLEMVLAFATSAFLYLVTEELLVEAHKGPDTSLATAMFFVGFLLMIVIEVSTT